VNDGAERIDAWVKGDSTFHPDGLLQIGGALFGGAALLELLSAAAWAGIISSDHHLFSL